MNRKLVIAVVVLATGGAGAGGVYAYKRNSDPLRRAEAMADNGNLRGAQVELRNAIRGQPNNADVHLRMARLQMKLADPVAAEKEFRAAAGFGADRWAIIPQLGEAMLAQGHNRDVLNQIPARGPSPEITARTLLLRSIAQIGLHDMPAAAASLADAEKQAPGRVEVAIIAARVAAARDDLPLTRAKVDEVLRQDPNQIDALLMKERLLTAAGDRPAALLIADQAVASAPWSAMAHMNRASQLLFIAQDSRAQEDVNAVLAVQPRFDEAIYLNGVLMARRGQLNEAAIELAKLDTSTVRFPGAIYYEAIVAAQQGQTQSAAEFARRYNVLVPADPEGQRLLARTELAANRPEAALLLLERAVVDGHTDPETLDMLGRAYIALGRTPLALQAFNKAVTLAPDNADFLTHLGIAQLQEGNNAGAASTLERSYGMAPKLQTAGEALVAASLGVGDVPRAQAALAKLRAEAGETESVGILTGMVLLRQGDFDGARTALATTVRAFPNSVNAKLNLARVYLQQGRRAAGLQIMAEVLGKDPANLQMLNAYLLLLAQDNQLPLAVLALETARKADPKQPVLTAMLADAYSATGDAPRAVSLLEGEQSKGALPPLLLAPYARALTVTGRVDEAKSAYRELLIATPTDLVARSGQVELLLRTQDLSSTRVTLREALAAMPGNYRIMSALVAIEAATKGQNAALQLVGELRANPANLPNAALLKADILSRAGRFDDAAQALQGEFAEAPSLPLLIRLAGALSSAGRDHAAVAQLRTWLKDQPNTPDAAQLLAKFDVKAHRYDDAQAHLAIVLQQRPNDSLALNNLAWTYFLVHDPRARATAQLAYLQSPSPDAADTLGWIMVQEGASKAAVPLLQQSSKQRPNDPSIHYHLAVALKDDGQPDEAAALLRSLVDGPAPFDEKDDARTLLTQLAR